MTKTFDERVALDVLREAQRRPPARPAGQRLQQVVDVLVVDLAEGNPNGELDVRLRLQRHLVLLACPLCGPKGKEFDKGRRFDSSN